MKNIIYIFAIGFIFAACSSQDVVNTEIEEEIEINYVSFGADMTPDDAIDYEEMTQKFKSLSEGDTIDIKFESSIAQVCQKKGCWMKMALADEESVFIRFTDYGFFVPFNAGEHKAIVEGRAFLSVVTVDELKHYAKDAGKSQEEIDAITEPEISYAIQADGVLIEDIAISEGDIYAEKH